MIEQPATGVRPDNADAATARGHQPPREVAAREVAAREVAAREVAARDRLERREVAAHDLEPREVTPTDLAPSDVEPLDVAPRDLTSATDDLPGLDTVVDTRTLTRELFALLGELPADHPRRAKIRDRLVEMHLPLVEHLARRFRNRGEPLDDLIQVGTIGLIKSVDRFDSDRGVEFSTYATPTIVGELKRHFRDRGWAIRVPRRLQELRLSLATVTGDLTQELGRAPTVGELSGKLGVREEEVLEGLESANAYSTLSLDAPDQGQDDAPAVVDSLGSEDEALEGVEYREALRPLLTQLPDREKRILLLRFFKGMTQSQIASEVGISQMHVSRLLSRTLAQLRERLLQD